MGLDPRGFYGTMRDLYDEAMTYQDHQLGRFVDELKARGTWQTTLLIVASDHGHPAASYPRFGRGLLDPQPAAWEDVGRDHVAHAVACLRSPSARTQSPANIKLKNETALKQQPSFFPGNYNNMRRSCWQTNKGAGSHPPQTSVEK